MERKTFHKISKNISVTHNPYKHVKLFNNCSGNFSPAALILQMHFYSGVVFGCCRRVWGVQKRARMVLRCSRIKIGSTLDFRNSEFYIILNYEMWYFGFDGASTIWVPSPHLLSKKISSVRWRFFSWKT